MGLYGFRVPGLGLGCAFRPGLPRSAHLRQLHGGEEGDQAWRPANLLALDFTLNPKL